MLVDRLSAVGQLKVGVVTVLSNILGALHLLLGVRKDIQMLGCGQLTNRRLADFRAIKLLV